MLPKQVKFSKFLLQFRRSNTRLRGRELRYLTSILLQNRDNSALLHGHPCVLYPGGGGGEGGALLCAHSDTPPMEYDDVLHCINCDIINITAKSVKAKQLAISEKKKFPWCCKADQPAFCKVSLVKCWLPWSYQVDTIINLANLARNYRSRVRGAWSNFCVTLQV